MAKSFSCANRDYSEVYQRIAEAVQRLHPYKLSRAEKNEAVQNLILHYQQSAEPSVK